jgi:hypothetical protein
LVPTMLGLAVNRYKPDSDFLRAQRPLRETVNSKRIFSGIELHAAGNLSPRYQRRFLSARTPSRRSPLPRRNSAVVPSVEPMF